MDDVVFEITWDGSQQAELYYLADNEKVVAGRLVGRGKIRVDYKRRTAVGHHLEWSLMFPGKTLSGLKAAATVNGGDPVPAKAKGNQKQHWAWMLDA